MAQLWAKWGNGGTDSYPLTAHLIDTGLVARHLLTRWVPSRLVETLARRAQIDGAELTELVVTAAALHDIGKATPVFQGQLLTTPGPFADHTADLDAAGLDSSFVPVCAPGTVEHRLIRRHEVASAAIIDGPGASQRLPSSLAALAAGHHGIWEFATPDYPNATCFYDHLTTHPGWAGITAAVRTEVTALLGLAAIQNEAPAPVIAIATAVITLADWVVSSPDAITSGQASGFATYPAANIASRAAWLADHAERTLGRPGVPDVDVDAVFGFPLDRPVQRALRSPRPIGLAVVMAPMGDGKTEAALARWLGAGDDTGLYFALPTMATADAMFDRVRKLFTAAGVTQHGALLHSRSILNAFYHQPADIGPLDTGGASDRDPGLRPGDWFSGRHRALLAPVAVGTVDQLLGGALRQRYNALRLLSAATKTVVIDEVHSFDPYQSALLEGWLTWAGYLGVDVVLLSATLPKARLDAYLAAYAGGRPRSPAERHEGAEGTVRSPDASYPAVVTVDAHPHGDPTVQIRPIASSAAGQDVTVSYRRATNIPATIAAVAGELAAAHPSAKIGVICNRVGHAQVVAEALGTSAVLHSRLTAGQRSAVAQDIISRFGKESGAGPDMCVATQVVEQSIDVDFDILVTELAPSAALLQRLGRLWRHPARPSRQRPDTLDGPLTVIVTPDALDDEGAMVLAPAVALPYSSAEMNRTWAAALHSGKRSTISLPDDITSIVEAGQVTLADMAADVAGASGHWAAVAGRLRQAKRRRIPLPGAVEDTAALMQFSVSVDGAGDERATRWIEMTDATLIVVGHGGVSADKLPPAGSHLGRDQAIALLEASVPVSGSLADRLLRASEQGSPTVTPVRWDHRLLDGMLVVHTDSPGCPVTYDRILGLRKAPRQ